MIKDAQKFLRYYQSLYKEDYNRTKSQKIISLLPFELSDKKILELGCGGGIYSLACAKGGCKNIILLDLSRASVKAAKLNLLKNANLDAEGVVADAANIPFKNEHFDFVLCLDLIEHLKSDDALIQNIEKVLKNNGLLLISTQNSKSINYILEALIRRYVLKNHYWMGWDPTHLRFYTPKSLFKKLKKHKLTPIKMVGTYFIPYLPVRKLSKIPRRIGRIIYYIRIIFYAMRLINEKLEKNYNAFWKLFGWNITYLCVKYPKILI